MLHCSGIFTTFWFSNSNNFQAYHNFPVNLVPRFPMKHIPELGKKMLTVLLVQLVASANRFSLLGAMFPNSKCCRTRFSKVLESWCRSNQLPAFLGSPRTLEPFITCCPFSVTVSYCIFGSTITGSPVSLIVRKRKRILWFLRVTALFQFINLDESTNILQEKHGEINEVAVTPFLLVYQWIVNLEMIMDWLACKCSTYQSLLKG